MKNKTNHIAVFLVALAGAGLAVRFLGTFLHLASAAEKICLDRFKKRRGKNNE